MKFFQSSIVLEDQYLFRLVLHSSFHHALEHLVMLTFFEDLYQIESEILVYSWMISLSNSLFDISVVSTFLIAFVSSVTNSSSSSSLFLMIVHCLSWINSSMIDITTVKGVPLIDAAPKCTTDMSVGFIKWSPTYHLAICVFSTDLTLFLDLRGRNLVKGLMREQMWWYCLAFVQMWRYFTWLCFAFKKHRWNSACYDLPMYTAIRRASSQIQTTSHLHSRLHVSAINLGSKKRKSVYWLFFLPKMTLMFSVASRSRSPTYDGEIWGGSPKA